MLRRRRRTSASVSQWRGGDALVGLPQRRVACGAKHPDVKVKPVTCVAGGRFGPVMPRDPCIWFFCLPPEGWTVGDAAMRQCRDRLGRLTLMSRPGRVSLQMELRERLVSECLGSSLEQGVASLPDSMELFCICRKIFEYSSNFFVLSQRIWTLQLQNRSSVLQDGEQGLPLQVRPSRLDICEDRVGHAVGNA